MRTRATAETARTIEIPGNQTRRSRLMLETANSAVARAPIRVNNAHTGNAARNKGSTTTATESLPARSHTVHAHKEAASETATLPQAATRDAAARAMGLPRSRGSKGRPHSGHRYSVRAVSEYPQRRHRGCAFIDRDRKQRIRGGPTVGLSCGPPATTIWVASVYPTTD